MLNNNYNKTKSKSATDAQSATEHIREAQKQQEKSKLQMQIDNRKHEADRLAIDIKTQEGRLTEIKRKLEDAKRVSFLLEGEIKKLEGGIGYLNDQAQGQKGQVTAREGQLQVLEVKRQGVQAEINKLKKEIAERESLLASKNAESEKINQEYKSLELGVDQVAGDEGRLLKNVQIKKKEIEKQKQDLIFRKRAVGQFERDIEQMSQTIARLHKEKENKDREMDDLKRKRDQL